HRTDPSGKWSRGTGNGIRRDVPPDRQSGQLSLEKRLRGPVVFPVGVGGEGGGSTNMIRVVKPEELDTRRREGGIETDQERKLQEILSAVRQEGDRALRRYTEQFDGAALQNFRVTDGEIDAAYERVTPKWLEALREAARRIRRYHERQKRQSWIAP